MSNSIGFLSNFKLRPARYSSKRSQSSLKSPNSKTVTTTESTPSAGSITARSLEMKAILFPFSRLRLHLFFTLAL